MKSTVNMATDLAKNMAMGTGITVNMIGEITEITTWTGIEVEIGTAVITEDERVFNVIENISF